jgi:hypothetical protein
MNNSPLIFTKTALKAICQFVISKTPDGELLGPKEAKFVTELFRRHPDYQEKSAPGIRGFSVRTDRRWGTSRHFVVERVDGTSIDFSWQICLDAKCPDKATLVEDSLRNSVVDQVIAFREAAFANTKELVCPLTGELVNSRECHVDHIPPGTFEVMVTVWLMRRGLTYDGIALEPAPDGYGQELANPDQRASWRAFHALHAKLRVVSCRAKH